MSKLRWLKISDGIMLKSIIYVVLFVVYIFPVGLFTNYDIPFDKLIFTAVTFSLYIFWVCKEKKVRKNHLIFFVVVMLFCIINKTIKYLMFTNILLLEYVVDNKDKVELILKRSNILYICLGFTFLYSIMNFGEKGRYAYSAIMEINQSGLAIFCLAMLLLKKNKIIGYIVMSLGLLTISRSYYLATIIYVISKLKFVRSLLNKLKGKIRYFDYANITIFTNIILIIIGIFFLVKYNMGEIFWGDEVSNRLINLFDYSNLYRFVANLIVVFVFIKNPLKLFTGVTKIEYINWGKIFYEKFTIPDKYVSPHNLFFSHLKIYGIFVILEIMYTSNIIKRVINQNNFMIYLSIIAYSTILGAGTYSYWLYLSVFVFIEYENIDVSKGIGSEKLNSPKKIILIDECLDRVGGVERVICTLANTLIEDRNIEVISVFKQKEQPFYKYDEKIKIKYLINEEKSKTIDMKEKSLFYYFIRAFEKIKKKLLLRRKIEEALENVTSDDVLIFGRVFTALDFLPVLKNKKIQAKVIVRDAIHLEYYSSRVRRNMLKFFPRFVDVFIVSSDESIKVYEKFFKDKNIKTEKIYNPLGITPTLCGNKKNKTIVSIGRMDSQKGYENLIEAYKIILERGYDWKLKIYGDGIYKSKIERLIKELGLQDNVLLLPTTKDVIEVFKESSIFVLPSRYEGYANILVEAMACGVPSVSYNWLMGVEEIITNNKNGLVVKLKNRYDYFKGINNKEDQEKLAEAIIRLIDDDKLYNRFSKEAQLIVESRKIEKVIEKWIKIVE